MERSDKSISIMIQNYSNHMADFYCQILRYADRIEPDMNKIADLEALAMGNALFHGYWVARDNTKERAAILAEFVHEFPRIFLQNIPKFPNSVVPQRFIKKISAYSENTILSHSKNSVPIFWESFKYDFDRQKFAHENNIELVAMHSECARRLMTRVLMSPKFHSEGANDWVSFEITIAQTALSIMKLLRSA